MTDPTIHQFVLGEFQTNCYVVTLADSLSCWVVDCGQQPEKLAGFINSMKLTPQALLLTHAHCDHIWGVDRLRSELGEMPIFLHENEHEWPSNPMLNLSGLFGMPVSVAGPTDSLVGGQGLELGTTKWRVLHTPGHSPGSVCFVHDDSKQAIVGDTLFAGGIGRVDFPTSDPDAMRRSLFDTILSLPDDMRIFPGHGPSTTIGAERAGNPFLNGAW